MSLLTTASLVVTPNAGEEGTLFSIVPDTGLGDMSVTRATTATRVNSAGLVELVPYNLLSYSEQFDNGAWTKSNVSVTANSTTAPNGTLTADTIVNTATSGILLQVSPSLSPSQLVTFSVYLKRSNNDWVNVAIARNGATTYGELYVWFNIATGAVGSNLPDGAAVFVDADIENVGDGWYRCSVTGYVPNAVAYTAFVFNASADNSFTTSIGQSRYQWGAQLVEGTIKPYQKTETRLNIPRLDYSNGTCPSLLVEPQRTNLALYSSSFDSVFWDKSSGTITTNATTSPDGNITAELFTANGTFNNHDFFQGFTGGSSTTSSIYVKKNTAQYAYISLNYQGSGSDWATGVYDLDNLTTATFQSGGVTNQVATISDEGNGWRRITLSVSTANTALFCMYGVADSMSPSLSARGRVENSSSASFYAWGAQLEVGSYATSYIPTTSASVTRNADVISKTGISSLIGQTEGTLFVEVYNYNNFTSTSSVPFSISNGSYGDAVYFEVYQNLWYASVFVGFNAQFQQTVGALSTGYHKLAVAYKANDFVFYVDGSLVASDTSGSVPACSRTDIGTVGISTSPEEMQVKAAALWKTRLTNTQLAALTTI